MPDTPELQEAFGQPDRQKKGCGFPVAKLVAMFCWASGAVLDVAIGPYRSSELSLWHQLWDQLQAADMVLGDRFYGAYVELAQLTARHCEGVFRLWGARTRTIEFRRGWRLGKDDRLFVWSRSSWRPQTLSRRGLCPVACDDDRAGASVHTQVKGFRSRTILVATTLLDPVQYPVACIMQPPWRP